jgi:hypothetical protein
MNNQKNMQKKDLNDYISTDLGKLNLARKYTDLANFKQSENIKIFDLRKNENFGEVHMFQEKPSPFTLRIRSRIVEVLLLRKQEAFSISNNFPNIWRKIHRTSYHNLVSLKKVTYKNLQQYYNSHFYNKNKKQHNLDLNLDASTSFISMIDNQFHSKLRETYSKNSIVKSKDSFLLSPKKKPSTHLSNDVIKIKHDSSFGSNISSFAGIRKSNSKVTNRFNSENNNRKTGKDNYLRKNDKNLHTMIKSSNTDKRINENKEQTSQLNTSRNGQNFNTSIEYYKEIIKSMHESKVEDNSQTLINKPIKMNNENYSLSSDTEKIFTLKD